MGQTCRSGGMIEMSEKDQNKLEVKKSEIYKVFRKNSKLDAPEWHFKTNENDNKLKATHFPGGAFIDKDTHSDIEIINSKKFGKIYNDERGRILDEYMRFMEGDEEAARKHIETSDDWLDEFINIPDEIDGRDLIIKDEQE